MTASRAARVGLLAALTLVLPLVAGAACAGGADPAGPATTTPSGTTAPTSAGTPSPGSGTAAPTAALPVYYIADTAAGPRLYREFHAVPTTDRASDAVRKMLASDTGTDPDYRSHWPTGTTLHSPVRHADGVITVDPSGSARAGQFGAELAELTIQQLVYTVQGALQSTDPVRVLVEGAAVPELWGHVSTAEPIRRADPYATRSLVQIDNPAHGATVGRTVSVSGEAAAFEANVPWQVLRADGTVVTAGNATAAEGQRFSAFSFTLTLEPGEYTVRVSEDDPSGGAGRQPFTDTKLVRVTG